MPSSAPRSVIIVGAGVFGLSTALAIARRHPSTTVTIVDRLTPPVEDGTSVDTTRCIRADYGDPIYARLAAKSQRLIEGDPELQPHYFKQGMSFIFDGKQGPSMTFINTGIESVKKEQGEADIEYMHTPEAVFRRIHGQDSQLVPEQSLNGERKWNKGYNNKGAAFIDAKESIRVYYKRCLTKPSLKFECGVAVDHLSVSSGRVSGVVLEDGRQLLADLVIVAAGAWSNKLVHLEGSMYSSAIEVAWIKLTDAEVDKWKNMSITTNLSTGFNLFPPHNGEMKCLRRSAGYINTVKLRHPEDSAKTISVSLPRTIVTNPTDSIPANAEASLREDLRELMPSLADRPFDRTKLCWIAQTPSADFIICPHPRISGLHLATGGSAHGWKFLPIMGDLVLDSVEGKLDKELVEKWAFVKKPQNKGNAPRMTGAPQEIRHLMQSRL